MEDSNQYSHMQHGQFGADSAHHNAQLQHEGGVYDQGHHQGSYSSNQYNSGSMHAYPQPGMAYYHPSMYGFPPTMVNPASMGTGSQAGGQSGHAGSQASQDANAQHYMHFAPGQHHYFAQPGMMPGMMQHGHLQAGQQHGQAGHHSQAAQLGVQGYGSLPAAGGVAGGKKSKTAGAASGGKKTKGSSSKVGVNTPANVAAAAAAAAAAGLPAFGMNPPPPAPLGAMPGMPGIPGFGATSKGMKNGANAAANAAAAKEAKKKAEKEQKKVIRSHLKQPKQAPSAWQLFFAEELAKLKAEKPEERLNVAHVAKGAGEKYNSLSDAEKAKYINQSAAAKAQWEKDLAAWKASLSPEDIKLENAYRTQQRKAGKSRKSNLKDPHAPKKPLSAYFLFLRAIRSDDKLTEEVFGKEGETTKQSVLAATKWRELPEDQKQPYLQKAEQDKVRYDEARRVYEAAQNRGVEASLAAIEADKQGKAVAQDWADKSSAVQTLIMQGLPAGISFNMDDPSNISKRSQQQAANANALAAAAAAYSDDVDESEHAANDQHLQTAKSGSSKGVRK